MTPLLFTQRMLSVERWKVSNNRKPVESCLVLIGVVLRSVRSKP